MRTSEQFAKLVSKEKYVDLIYSMLPHEDKTKVNLLKISKDYDYKSQALFVLADENHNLKFPNHFKFDLLQGFKKISTFEIKSNVVLFEQKKLDEICFIISKTNIQRRT